MLRTFSAKRGPYAIRPEPPAHAGHLDLSNDEERRGARRCASFWPAWPGVRTFLCGYAAPIRRRHALARAVDDPSAAASGGVGLALSRAHNFHALHSGRGSRKFTRRMAALLAALARDDARGDRARLDR